MLKDVRWGHGFFRLWVALSALWAILFCAVMWQPIVAPLPLGSGYLVEPLDAEPRKFPRYSGEWSDAEARVRSNSLRQTQIDFHGRTDTAIFYPTSTTDEEEERLFQSLRERVVSDREAEISDIRSTNIKSLLIWTFAPIFSLLAFGLTLRWVMMGFMRQAKT